MGKKYFDGDIWVPWKNEREAQPGERLSITAVYAKTGEKFKIYTDDDTIDGKQCLTKQRLELWLWACRQRANAVMRKHRHVDPTLTLASEIGKSEAWDIEEVVTEPYDPDVKY